MSLSVSNVGYEFYHGRTPKGVGMWAFDITRRVEYADRVVSETTVVFAHRPMTYSEAKRWIRHNLAGQRDVLSISVAP